MGMHVLVKEGLQPVSRLVIWGLASIVNPGIVAYAAHVCSKDVQCEVVILLLQTLLHQGQVHWILQQATMSLADLCSISLPCCHTLLYVLCTATSHNAVVWEMCTDQQNMQANVDRTTSSASACKPPWAKLIVPQAYTCTWGMSTPNLSALSWPQHESRPKSHSSSVTRLSPTEQELQNQYW